MQWDVVDEAELERVKAMSEDELMEWYEEFENRPSFDFDKVWHGVHAVLTHSAWDASGLGRAILGGTAFGDDSGYAPPRAMSAAEVCEVADMLDGLSVEEFRSRIDFDELVRLDIYPNIWDRVDEQPDLADELTGYYDQLRTEYRRAADAGQAMVISLL